jgi:RNA polymerase sigma factor (sigma-70 family)
MSCPDNTVHLLARAREGDNAAMGQVMEKYAPVLRQAAQKLIGRPLRSSLDAEDLVQSIQIILLKGIQSGKFIILTPAQYVSVAKVLLQRNLSRHWREYKRLNCATTIDGPLFAKMGDTLPDQPLMKKAVGECPDDVESLHTVEKILRKLQPLDRRLVELRMEGHTTAEAARLLNLDAGFLRVRLGRLREKLQSLRTRP